MSRYVAIAIGAVVIICGLMIGAYHRGDQQGFMRAWELRGRDCVNSGGTIDEEQDGYHYVPWWRRRRIRTGDEQPTPAAKPSIVEESIDVHEQHDGEAELIRPPDDVQHTGPRPCEVQ